MSLVFFTDRDLGRQFPAILQQAGLSVVRHGDHFRPNATDEEWLERAGREGWTAVTHDSRIRYKSNERDAVVRHTVPLFVVVGKAPFAQLAANFVATVPRIEEFLRQHQPPFIAKVHRPSQADLVRNPSAPGTVTLWYPR